jgi:hypothetical protein
LGAAAARKCDSPAAASCDANPGLAMLRAQRRARVRRAPGRARASARKALRTARLAARATHPPDARAARDAPVRARRRRVQGRAKRVVRERVESVGQGKGQGTGRQVRTTTCSRVRGAAPLIPRAQPHALVQPRAAPRRSRATSKRRLA